MPYCEDLCTFGRELVVASTFGLIDPRSSLPRGSKNRLSNEDNLNPTMLLLALHSSPGVVLVLLAVDTRGLGCSIKWLGQLCNTKAR
jgi:hypothetical protein